jgi:ubiquinone/menaquinone biosynthesis C-methylase UbiE
MARQFDNFDQFAQDYRDIHNENIKISGADSEYFAEYKILEIKEIEDITSSLRILDLGCGDGISAVFFNQHFPKSNYLGIDVSEESIEVARQRQVANASFDAYDGYTIPQPDETFDMAFIACVLHHINFDNHAQVLKEVRRVLKKGGRLYIFEHNPYNPVTQKIVKDCPFDDDAVLLSPPYSRRLLQKVVGFAKTNIRYTIFFPRKGFFKKLLFLEKYMNWIPMGGQYFTRSVR